MTDYGKPRNDKSHQGDQAHGLTEQLSLLEAVDRRMTPEHVAKRFRQLLEDISDDRPPSSAAEQLPHRILDQPACGNQLTGPRREYNAEPTAAAELKITLEASKELPTATAELTITVVPLQAPEANVQARKQKSAGDRTASSSVA